METSATYDLNDELQLDRLAAALNSTVRRKMLRLLGENSYSVLGLAETLNLRITPELSFVPDDSIEYGEHINSLFRKIETEAKPDSEKDGKRDE